MIAYFSFTIAYFLPVVIAYFSVNYDYLFFVIFIPVTAAKIKKRLL
jgi:hypothetical protein